MRLSHLTPIMRRVRFLPALWLLEEIGAPFELKLVSIRRGDGSGVRDPMNPHPHGKVPAIVHDGVPVFETTAIALYLTDTFPDAGFGAKIGADRLLVTRAALLQWRFRALADGKIPQHPAHLRHLRLGPVR